MVMIESTNSAALRRKLRSAAQRTKEENTLRDTYVLYQTSRPVSTWDDGTEPELKKVMASGKCKLYAAGAGGPRIADMILPESPYRIRLAVGPLLEEGRVPNLVGAVVVINYARVFRVDDLKVEDKDDYLGDLFVTEIPGKAVLA